MRTVSGSFLLDEIAAENKINLIESEMWVMHRNLPFVELPHKKTKTFELKENNFNIDKMVDLFMDYDFGYFLSNLDEKWEIFYG